ncbi:helix-turn-helix transcriptional regulator [Bordetella sp. 02P26C-1]|uniref:helix-turn-helix transcriptional regulator n=1 Tax=Bordetella sp. 02P26C-1 TaxID=2683195 RepID=UPI001352F633|nr:helix-turn-helix domain-containing protein [Bordetella sp. 02P26C-1]MVW80110.1 helix-turn-helix domain-containing protein [Bordetella sp. 02P26C-1]
MNTAIPAVNLTGDGLLKFQQVADMLGIHRATLYDWIHKEEFPEPIQIRGRNFYRVGTFTNWLNTHAPEARFDRTIVKH